MSDLNARLLAAHDRGQHHALVSLYAQAADQAATIDVACFYLTHAYIFALEQNHPDAADLRARLAKHGRI